MKFFFSFPYLPLFSFLSLPSLPPFLLSLTFFIVFHLLLKYFSFLCLPLTLNENHELLFMFLLEVEVLALR